MVTGELDQLQHFPGNFPLLLLWGFSQTEAIGHILLHSHMGEKGIILENGIHVPFIGGQGGNIRSSQKDTAAVGFLQASDDPQGGCFSAAAGTQEGNKLSLMDIDTDSPEDLGFAEGLRNILELEDKIRHFAPP